VTSGALVALGGGDACMTAANGGMRLCIEQTACRAWKNREVGAMKESTAT